jgi:hypothetical protein
MGNKASTYSSNDKVLSIKHDLEEMYKQVLSPQNIEKTIKEDYCKNLQISFTNNVLKKYSDAYLKESANSIVLGYSDAQAQESKQEICTRLSDYFIKKINLVGTIINSIRLAHLKIDRIKNGRGLCIAPGGGGEQKMKPSNKSFKLPVDPSIPFKFNAKNTGLIFLDEDILNIRKETFKKVSASGVEMNEEGLLHKLALIEIDNSRECKNNGGQWISTRKQAEKLYVIPSPDLKNENKKWFDTLNKLESSVYGIIGELISSLAVLIEERIEPKMINGKEERVKIYRDRLIFDKDLDSVVLKTKRQLIELFIQLDSYFIILMTMNVVGAEHLTEIKEAEDRLKKLKSRINN